jgi:glycosyltransferase involved in cell wall biosynthesis
MSADPEVSLVVPAYNEHENLPLMVDAVTSALTGCCTDAELIFVDDGSRDRTWAAITELAAQSAAKGGLAVRGIRLSRNFGKENALCAGLDQARGRAIVVMDGDLQHPPALLPSMIQSWRNHEADIVEAVKVDNRQAGTIARLRSSLFQKFFQKATGVNLSGATDFKLMDRRVIEAWSSMPERALFFRGMTAWLGFRRTSVPFVVPQRVHGLSGWSVLRLLRLAGDALTSFSVVPLRLVTVLGSIFLVFATLFSAYALTLKLSGHSLTGFTTITILLLITGGCIMISLGLIGEYIGRIYDEVKARPRYVVAEQAGAWVTPPTATPPRPSVG